MRTFIEEKYGPGGWKAHKKIFILFFDNNLKAVFKPSEPHDREKSILAYRFSNFMEFYFIPPTVIRTIDGETGPVQLFVEGNSIGLLTAARNSSFMSTLFNAFRIPYFFSGRGKKKATEISMSDNHNDTFNRQNLSEIQKSDIYIYYFVLGNTDPGPSDILISRRCKLPVLIDNDDIELTYHSYGDYPYTPFLADKDLDISSTEDFKTFPLNKVQFLKTSLFELEKSLPDMKVNDFNNFKKFIQKAFEWTSLSENGIYFVKWKGNFWIKKNFETHFIYKNPPFVFSGKTLKNLKRLNEGILRDLFLQKDRSKISGWFHRRDVIIEVAKKNQIVP